MRIFIITLMFLFCNILGYAQDKEAIRTSQKVINSIQKQDYKAFYSLIEKSIREQVGSNVIRKEMREVARNISGGKIDFTNYMTEFQGLLHSNDTLPKFITYRYTISGSDKADYFEVSFFTDSNHKKITGVSTVKTTRLKSYVKNPVKNGLPAIDEVKVEKYKDSEIVHYIKYRSDTKYHIVELDRKQRKFIETISPIDSLNEREVIHYYSNGNIKFIGHYHNNLAEGLFKKYYKNGYPEAIGYLKYSEKNGQWIYYDEKGNIVNKEIYKDGKLLKD